jgi:hypothetical protein
MTTNTSTISIRAAIHGDGPALARLAALDSAPVPFGPVLLAEVDGRPAAALAVNEDRVIADPFVRTAEIAEMLRVQARATSEHGERALPRTLAALRLAA